MSSTAKETKPEWKPSMIDNMKGCLFCAIWSLSITFGFYFLFAPLIPLLFINRRLYRRFTDLAFTAWESFNVSLLEIVFGVRTYVTGDSIRAEETSLIILNHPTRLDWGFLWSAMLHASVPPAHNAKFVLKDAVKNIPAGGWILQMCRSVFIDRCWKTDENKIGNMIEYLASTYNNQTSPKQISHERNISNFQLILFPEGTNIKDSSMIKSNQFADKSNLKRMNNVLHPRTTGFSYITTKMRECECLDAVYDVTIAYPEKKPKNEYDILHGMFPEEVHFHIKRYGVQTVPTTWIGLEKWIQEVWREKDHMLSNVYNEGKKFPALNFRQHKPQLIIPLQYLSLFAFCSFIYWSMKSLFLSPFSSPLTIFLWAWIVCVTLSMLMISKYTPGMQEIEILLEKGTLLKTIWACAKGKNKSSINSDKQD